MPAPTREWESYLRQLAEGQGLKVTSARRTPKQNAAVGGAKGSYHLSGAALDIGGDPKKLKALADRLAKEHGSELAEIFYDPVGGWKDGKPVGAIGKHGDHLHVAWPDGRSKRRGTLGDRSGGTSLGEGRREIGRRMSAASDPFIEELAAKFVGQGSGGAKAPGPAKPTSANTDAPGTVGASDPFIEELAAKFVGQKAPAAQAAPKPQRLRPAKNLPATAARDRGEVYGPPKDARAPLPVGPPKEAMSVEDQVRGPRRLNPFLPTSSGGSLASRPTPNAAPPPVTKRYEAFRPRTALEKIGRDLQPENPKRALDQRINRWERYMRSGKYGPNFQFSEDPTIAAEEGANIARLDAHLDAYQRQIKPGPLGASVWEPARVREFLAKRGVRLTEAQEKALPSLAVSRMADMEEKPRYQDAIAAEVATLLPSTLVGIGAEQLAAQKLAGLAGKVIPKLPAAVQRAAGSAAGKAAGRVLNPARLAGSAVEGELQQQALDAAFGRENTPGAGAKAGLVGSLAFGAGREVLGGAKRAILGPGRQPQVAPPTPPPQMPPSVVPDPAAAVPEAAVVPEQAAAPPPRPESPSAPPAAAQPPVEPVAPEAPGVGAAAPTAPPAGTVVPEAAAVPETPAAAAAPPKPAPASEAVAPEAPKAPEAAEVVPPGLRKSVAAVLAGPPKDATTGVARLVREREAAQDLLDPYIPGTGIRPGEALEYGESVLQGKGDDAIGHATRLLDEVSRRDQPPSWKEIGIIGAGNARVRYLVDQRREAMRQAMGSGADEKTIREATLAYELARAQFQDYAEKTRGTAWGNTGRAMQEMAEFNKNDGSYDAVLLRAEGRLGRKLTDSPQDQKIKDALSRAVEGDDGLKAASEALSQAEAQAKRASGAADLADIVEVSKETRVVTKDDYDEFVDVLRDALNRAAGGINMSALGPLKESLDPKVWKALIGASIYHIERGVNKFDPWAKEIAAVVGDRFTDDQLRAIYRAANSELRARRKQLPAGNVQVPGGKKAKQADLPEDASDLAKHAWKLIHSGDFNSVDEVIERVRTDMKKAGQPVPEPNAILDEVIPYTQSARRPDPARPVTPQEQANRLKEQVRRYAALTKEIADLKARVLREKGPRKEATSKRLAALGRQARWLRGELEQEAKLKGEVEQLRKGVRVTAKPRESAKHTPQVAALLDERKRLREAMDKSAREATAAKRKAAADTKRLQKRATELDAEIAAYRAGKPPVKPEPAPRGKDPLAGKVAERNDLRAQEKAKQDIAKLRKGEDPSKPQAAPKRSAELEALLKERQRLAAELRKAKDAPKLAAAKAKAEADRAAKREAAIDKEIADLEAGGAPKSTQRTARPADPLAAKVARRNDLREQARLRGEIAATKAGVKVTTRAAAKPQPSPELKALRDELATVRREAGESDRIRKRAEDLKQQIEALQRGEVPQGRPKPKLTPEIAKLQKERDDLLKDLRKPERDAKRLVAREQRLRDKIADLEAGKEPPVRDTAPKGEDPLADLEWQARDMELLARARRKIAEYEEALRTKKAPPKEERAKHKASQELENARAVERLRRAEVDKLINRLGPKDFWDRVQASTGWIMAVKLGGDAGVVLRQGQVALVNPVVFGKSLRAGLTAAKSDLEYELIRTAQRDEVLNGMPAEVLWKRVDLRMTDKHVTPEEFGISKALSEGLVKHVPVLGKLERFQLGYINTVRAELFKKAVGENMTEDEMKLVARYINSTTGRGNAKNIPKELHAIMLSPNWEVSRWEMVAAPFYYGGAALKSAALTGRVDKGSAFALKQMVKQTAGLFGLLQAARLAGYETAFEVNVDEQGRPTLDKDGAVKYGIYLRRGREVWDISAGVNSRLIDILRTAAWHRTQNPEYAFGKTVSRVASRTISPSVRVPVEFVTEQYQELEGLPPRSFFTGYMADEKERGWWAFAPMLAASVASAVEEEESFLLPIETGLKEFAGTSVKFYD